MLVNDKLDKQVFQRALSEVKPNDLGIHYGVDDNKIKGVSHFPVFSDYSGIHISAKPTAEEFMYTKPVGNQYTVGKPSHHAPPSVHSLYDFNADGKMHAHASPHANYRGIGNSLYGLPDLTINIDNYAAREAGVVGITNKQMMRNNWQKEEQQLPDGLEEIINRGSSRRVDIEAGESKGESKDTNWDELEAGESKGESKGEYKVRSKGESKEEYKVRSKSESKAESKSHVRVMAQPAFGSSSPKQGEERGLELRPLGQIVNERRMHTPARPKEPDSPEFKTPLESQPKKFRSPRTLTTPKTPREEEPAGKKTPAADRSDSDSGDDELPLDLQKIVIQLTNKPIDYEVSKAELERINYVLIQQGKPKLHGNISKKVGNVLKKVRTSIQGEESAMKKAWDLMGFK